MLVRCPHCAKDYRFVPGVEPICPACGRSPDAAAPPAGGEPPAPAASGPRAAVPRPDSRIGKVIGGYRLLARLGEGGMSTVYMARQGVSGIPVAFKIAHREFTADARHLSRFEQEARTLAQLDHPHIVRVYETARDGDVFFIAMEYVAGTSLDRLIAERKSIAAADALPLFAMCCAALSCAHRAKVVHRDVKPDNILVSGDGRVKMTDFGLAKRLDMDAGLSIPGTVLGTPLYMSPEQAGMRPVDERSDLYSLGVTFYHAVVGRPPFVGPSSLQIAHMHLRDKPRPAQDANPAVPAGLSRILDRLMEKRPEDRYQTAEELAAALAACGVDGARG